MRRIGFATKPEFEPITIDLEFDRNYAGYVQYKADIRHGGTRIDPSLYLPKDLLPAKTYPSKVRITLEVPPKAKWRKY